MLAIVLAAGRGTRLLSLTKHRSKAVMPVAGKPMIERVLDMLHAGGVDVAVVVIHPSDAELVSFLTHSSRFPDIHLVYQEKRLGMAHAFRCAVPVVRDLDEEEFILASCDNLYPHSHVAELIGLRRRQQLAAALSLTWVPRREASGSAVVGLHEGRVTDILEKPDPDAIPRYGREGCALIAPSLYALTESILPYLDRVCPSSRGELEFTAVLRLLIGRGFRVGGLLVDRRLKLTRPQDLLTLNLHFLDSRRDRSLVECDIPADVTIVPPVLVEGDSRVGAGCAVGPSAYLEDGSQVGAGAVVRRSVVLRGGSVGPGEIVDGVVVGYAATYPSV
jgi:NDP-sugar pyrophosphorylase family protein